MGRVHRILRWIVFTLGGLFGLLAILVLAGPSIRSWQMERAIARFEKRPSQGRANTLVELLQMHAATGEQGKRALALLLRPNIVTRKAYAAGRPVTIGMDRPFDVNFRNLRRSDEMITINGLATMPQDDFSYLDRGISCLDVPALHMTQPGTYPIELRFRYSLWVERTSRGMTLLGHLHDALPRLVPVPWRWPACRAYACDFTMSAKAIVVTDGAAGRVGLVSSPELDKTMAAAFSAEHTGMQSTVATPTGTRRATGATHITYKDIPLAAAFSISLRLQDEPGVAQANPWRKEFSARAGSSGDFIVHPSNFGLTAPGRYDATLVLVPDPNLAYKDVAIKSIWSGTLEFPISFTIDAN